MVFVLSDDREFKLADNCVDYIVYELINFS